MALEAVSGQRTPEWVKGALDGWCREQAAQEARRHLPRARSESWEGKRACSWLLLHLKFTIRQRQSDKQRSKDLTCLSITFCVMKFCLLKNAGPGGQARTRILPQCALPTLHAHVVGAKPSSLFPGCPSCYPPGPLSAALSSLMQPHQVERWVH